MLGAGNLVAIRPDFLLMGEVVKDVEYRRSVTIHILPYSVEQRTQCAFCFGISLYAFEIRGMTA